MDQLLVGLLVFLLLLCDGPAPGRFTSLYYYFVMDQLLVGLLVFLLLLRDGPAPDRFTSLSTITS